MKSITHLLVLLVALSVGAGCSSSSKMENTSTPAPAQAPTAVSMTAASTVYAENASELAGAVQQAEALSNQLSVFEDQRKETLASLNTATNAVMERLDKNADPAEVRTATSAWRTNWAEVYQQIDQLDHMYTEVEAMSVRYFSQLNRQTATISDSQLRKAETNRNAELRQEWSRKSSLAAANFTELRSLVKEGNDFYVTLLNASIRPGSDRNLDKLKTISSRGSSLLNDLYEYTTTGRKLVGDDSSETKTPARATAKKGAKAGK